MKTRLPNPYPQNGTTKAKPVGRPKKPTPATIDRSTSILWGLFSVEIGRTALAGQLVGDYCRYSALFGGLQHTVKKSRG